MQNNNFYTTIYFDETEKLVATCQFLSALLAEKLNLGKRGICILLLYLSDIKKKKFLLLTSLN